MPQAEKIVRYIAPKASVSEEVKNKYRQKRVAAYCRVSTQQEEQINSYEVQTRYYTEKINAEPKWKLVKIFADKGISGTSTKHRDEFNKMIRMCKRGRIDMIITKSISRFARNTVDCLKYVRLLKDINVDVFFEEQGIHSIEKGSEFYITVYGSIAQSESENISANVRWGKEQSAREGNVSSHYKNFLGYRKGDDGNPEIVPEEAEIIRYIYERFLAGDSYQTIINNLQDRNILTPGGKKDGHTVRFTLFLQMNATWETPSSIRHTLLIASRRRKNATTANAPNTMSRTITRQLLTEPPLAKFRRKSPGEAD